MKVYQLLLLATVLFMPFIITAQSVAINDDGTTAHASAMLDVKVSAAAKKGVLIPRMTSTQRIAIASPAAGLMVYDTSTKSFFYFNGTAWVNMAGSSSGPWTVSGSNIYNTNSGNVGVGTSAPRARFNVAINRPVLFGYDTLGKGVKTFWLPSKAAFRSGVVNDPFEQGVPYNWDYTKIGYASFAAGGDCLASGNYSTAFGDLAVSTGYASFSAGLIAQAMGDYSAAFGEYSAAMGDISFAANSAVAQADQSAAFNSGNANGNGSFAANIGYAEADNSAAFGSDNIMRTRSGFAIGEYADPITALVETSNNEQNPLFIIGNGIYGARKNALTVLRNGRIGMAKLPASAGGAFNATLQIKSIGSYHALQLEAYSTTNKWSFGVSTNMGLYYNNALRGTFSSTTGGYTAVSDMRLKKDIMALGPVLQQLMALKPYTYHLKDNEATDPLSYGFMAQEVMDIMPGLVTQLQSEDGTNLLGMNYSNFGVLAIKGIQELGMAQQELGIKNEELGREVQKLGKENAELRNELQSLKEKLQEQDALLRKLAEKIN